jgi:hypothetical protein
LGVGSCADEDRNDQRAAEAASKSEAGEARAPRMGAAKHHHPT